MPARRGRAMTIRRPDDIAHAGAIETAAKRVKGLNPRAHACRTR